MLSSRPTIVLPSGVVVVIETRYSRESSAGLDHALFVSAEAIVMWVTTRHTPVIVAIQFPDVWMAPSAYNTSPIKPKRFVFAHKKSEIGSKPKKAN